jgi:hypothetical protein
LGPVKVVDGISGRPFIAGAFRSVEASLRRIGITITCSDQVPKHRCRDVRLGILRLYRWDLPGMAAGRSLIADIAHGFEYEPYRRRSNSKGVRGAGRAIKRIMTCNPRRYCGDTHPFLSIWGAAKDRRRISGSSICCSSVGESFSNIGFVDHQLLPRRKTIVYTSQENRQHILGHLSLLGLKSPVLPLSSDGSSEAEFGGSLETTLSRWADQCHAQGGQRSSALPIRTWKPRSSPPIA